MLSNRDKRTIILIRINQANKESLKWPVVVNINQRNNCNFVIKQNDTKPDMFALELEKDRIRLVPYAVSYAREAKKVSFSSSLPMSISL